VSFGYLTLCCSKSFSVCFSVLACFASSQFLSVPFAADMRLTENVHEDPLSKIEVPLADVSES
jgi:hypothetical protein